MPVRVEHPAPNVALVTLDRPEKANALDPDMLSSLAATWRDVAADADVRAVVLTGAGDRVFCGGMDIDATLPVAAALARKERIAPAAFASMRDVATALLAPYDIGKPIVAAVNGHARGGGLDLLLATDIRVASTASTFALEEVALGLYPTGNATVLLHRQIPAVFANELLYTATPRSAGWALRVGLVNRVVPPERVVPEALELASQIAGNAPLALAALHDGLLELAGMPLAEAYRRQEEIGRPLRGSADAAEARQARAERRPPNWQGR